MCFIFQVYHKQKFKWNFWHSCKLSYRLCVLPLSTRGFQAFALGFCFDSKIQRQLWKFDLFLHAKTLWNKTSNNLNWSPLALILTEILFSHFESKPVELAVVNAVYLRTQRDSESEIETRNVRVLCCCMWVGAELKFRGIASGALLNIKCGSAVIPFVWHWRRSNKTIFRCKFFESQF